MRGDWSANTWFSNEHFGEMKIPFTPKKKSKYYTKYASNHRLIGNSCASYLISNLKFLEQRTKSLSKVSTMFLTDKLNAPTDYCY